MKKLIIATAALAFTSAAWAQSATETTGVNSVLGIAPSTEDFVTRVASSDMFEIESSTLAVERSNDTTKTFARHMITEHEKTSAELKALVAAGKVEAALPTTMLEDHKETLDALKASQGEEFTEQYHADQIQAHENAVDLFTRYSQEGEQPDLKAWAAKTLPHLQQHLDMANELNK